MQPLWKESLKMSTVSLPVIPTCHPWGAIREKGGLAPTCRSAPECARQHIRNGESWNCPVSLSGGGSPAQRNVAVTGTTSDMRRNELRTHPQLQRTHNCAAGPETSHPMKAPGLRAAATYPILIMSNLTAAERVGRQSGHCLGLGVKGGTMASGLEGAFWGDGWALTPTMGTVAQRHAPFWGHHSTHYTSAVGLWTEHAKVRS